MSKYFFAFLFCLHTFGAEKIILYTGTFDPPHIGHVSVLQQAMKQIKADRAYVIPNLTSDHKEKISDYTHRKKMSEIGFGSIEHVVVADPKLMIAFKQGDIGKVRTKIFKLYPNAHLFQVMGDDSYERFLKATKNKKLFRTTILVAVRKDKIFHLQLKAQTPVILLNIIDREGMSSSRIRDEIKNGRPGTGLAEKVKAYIKEARLYGRP